MIGIGVLGLGSVFWGSYRPQIEKHEQSGRVELRAVYDVDEDRRRTVADRVGLVGGASEEALISRDDIDLVMVLTSMPHHGRLALAAMQAGKHVLVEKPMATTLPEAAELVRCAAEGRTHLVCAPHVLLAPTYREMWHRSPGRPDRRPAPRVGHATGGVAHGGGRGSTERAAVRCSTSGVTTSPRSAASWAR